MNLAGRRGCDLVLADVLEKRIGEAVKEVLAPGCAGGSGALAVTLRAGPERWGDLHGLARDDLIQATGTVEKILGGGRYQITLDEGGQTVTAQLSGRMRRFRIRVIPGDRVQVGLSPYDPTHGFITFRLREGQTGPN